VLDAIQGTLRKRTVQGHEQIARLHLKPALGKVRLGFTNSTITPDAQPAGSFTHSVVVPQYSIAYHALVLAPTMW
jgi:hypothetical protein